MVCPYCQAPAHETLAQCGACGFSLQSVDRFFGVMPRLQPGITDLAEVLSRRDHRRIAQAAARLRARFPQVDLSLVTTRLQPGQPLAAWTFWAFNRGGLWQELETGGKNHHILLALDVPGRRAALMIGYGLEPFLSRDHLRDVILAARPALASARHASAAIGAITALIGLLEQVAGRLARTYGLAPEHLAAPAPPPPLEPAEAY